MGSGGKESACNAGDPGSIPGLEKSPGAKNGYPLQYSCLENPVDRGAWQSMGFQRVRHNWVTNIFTSFFTLFKTAHTLQNCTWGYHWYILLSKTQCNQISLVFTNLLSEKQHLSLSSFAFPRQAYWSRLSFPYPGDRPNPGIEPGSPALKADSLASEPPGKPTTKISGN